MSKGEVTQNYGMSERNSVLLRQEMTGVTKLNCPLLKECFDGVLLSKTLKRRSTWLVKIKLVNVQKGCSRTMCDNVCVVSMTEMVFLNLRGQQNQNFIKAKNPPTPPKGRLQTSVESAKVAAAKGNE